MLKYLNKTVKQLNSSKFFAGIVMLMLNIGSRYIVVEFSDNQKELFKYSVFRQLLIFSIAWLGSRDIYISLILTAVFVILSNYLFNENSSLCIIPNKIKDIIDTNKDGKLSKEEIDKAIETLKRANK